MRSEVERGTKATLSTNENKEISLPVDHCYTEETYDDMMGYVAILKCSTALTDWHHFNCQSPISELRTE